jgi:hypothetical protein
MARTPESTALTAAHLAQQAGVRASVMRDVIRLFPMWDPDEPASWGRFVQAVTLLVQQRGTMSSALAARYYAMFRAADLSLTLGKAAAMVAPATAAQIERAMMSTAMSGYYRGRQAGLDKAAALRNALVQQTGSAARLAMQPGRETIVGAVRSDPRYHGWIRVSDGDPCAFCAMLLSRGPVYKEESAGFEAHDHCACGAEPFAAGSPWPEKNLTYNHLWQQTKHDPDTSPLNAFRRALNGTTEE